MYTITVFWGFFVYHKMRIQNALKSIRKEFYKVNNSYLYLSETYLYSCGFMEPFRLDLQFQCGQSLVENSDLSASEVVCHIS